jgi:hypothetical protein
MVTVKTDNFQPPVVNHEIPRARDWQVILRFEDNNGNPIDVSDRSFAMELRRDPTADLEVEANVQNGGYGDSHEVRLYFVPSDTADIDPAPHAHDIKETDANGTVRSIYRGTSFVTSEVTR